MTSFDSLLRELAPQVLGVLVRRHGDFDTCEDAVQEALLAAFAHWPSEGIPANPAGWLITVASRRRIEMIRQEVARRHREHVAARIEPPPAEPGPAVDDTLTLFLLCCHPSLTVGSQVALTLRAVGGLTTSEIARALLVPDATVGQRISRGKQRIKASGAQFRAPSADDLRARMPAVLRVLYLIFNEGYTASSGEALQRVELSREAIRLTRQLCARVPADGEIKGLLALMLLTDARRPARTTRDGALVPLAEQDRTLWQADAIAEGTALVTEALATAVVGPYQVQAAIAALHDEAATAADTDWAQILQLYDLLRHLAPGPMVTLGRVVAFAMVQGPQAGLDELDAASLLPGHHRTLAVRAHLLELLGDQEPARAAYRAAAERTLSLPERRYLQQRAALVLPPMVRRTAQSHGSAGEEWLAALPRFVEELRRAWSLEIDEVLPGGSSAFVARVRPAAVLKIAPPWEGLAGQARTLAAADGRGYVRLHAFDPEREAILLEPLGKMLGSARPEHTLDVLAQTLQEAWQVPRVAPPETDKASQLIEIISSLWPALGHPCSETLVEQALSYARQRVQAFDIDKCVVCHGDPHPANALAVLSPRAGAESGYVFVDPDGFLAEPAYDLGVALREWTDEVLAADRPADLLRGYCHRLARATGVDEEAIWQWGFVERVSSGLYLMAHGHLTEGRAYLISGERLISG